MANRLRTVDVPLTAADLSFLLELIEQLRDNSMKEPGDYTWTEYHARLEDDLTEAKNALSGEA